MVRFIPALSADLGYKEGIEKVLLLLLHTLMVHRIAILAATEDGRWEEKRLEGVGERKASTRPTDLPLKLVNPAVGNLPDKNHPSSLSLSQHSIAHILSIRSLGSSPAVRTLIGFTYSRKLSVDLHHIFRDNILVNVSQSPVHLSVPRHQRPCIYNDPSMRWLQTTELISISMLIYQTLFA